MQDAWDRPLTDGPPDSMDRSPDLICIADRTHFRRLNVAWEKCLGWTLEELMAAPIEEFVHPDDWERTQALAEQLEQHELVDFENRYRHKDGTHRWLLWSASKWQGGLTFAIARDITESKETEESLRESEERFRALVDSSAHHIFALDRNGTYVSSNGRVSQLGLEEGTPVVGRHFREFLPPAVADLYQQQSDRVFATGEVLSFDYFVPSPTGRRYHQDTLYPIRRDGRVRALGGICRDLTERRRTEDALRDSEERYRSVYDIAPLAFVVWDRERRVIDWNQQAERLFGWRRAEVLGRDFFEFLIPEKERVAIDDVVESLLQGELPSHSVNTNLTKSGSIILCEWSNAILHDSKGEPAAVISLALNITKRKRTEDALRESEEKYRSLMSHASDGILLADLEGNVVEANQKAEQLLGYVKNELRQMRLTDIHPPEEFVRATTAFEELVRDGAGGFGDTRVLRRDGQTISVDITGSVVHYAGKRLVQVIIRDVTQLKRVQEELERASRHKDEFLANMSHDLRTPLTAILGATHLLRSGRGHGKEERLLDIIHRNGNYLVELVNDILDLARVESGNLDLLPEGLPVADVVAEACLSVRSLAEQAHVEVHEEPAPPVHVWADPTRSLEILQNLLTNAIKFTPRGGRVSIDWRDCGDHCEVRVSDTGVGIPLDEQDEVFSRFKRSNIEPVHEGLPKGSGLGLALTRSLVEAQGGTITFDSEEGRGSTFRFTLPAAPTQAGQGGMEQTGQDTHEGLDQALESVHVLLIEDDPEISEMMETLLGLSGARATVAGTGEAGLRFAEDERPDVILLDMRLPDLDGYTVARRLREKEQTRGIPTIAVTAQAMAGDRERCLEAGCTDYVSKPVDPESLIKLIQRLTKRA